MKCTNNTIICIDHLDLAEMFYSENRDHIVKMIKGALDKFKGCDIESIKDEVSVKAKAEGILECSFRFDYSGGLSKDGEFHYSALPAITIWDVKSFLEDGWCVECVLKFPIIETNHGGYVPVWQEAEEMSDYVKDLIENDDKLLREVRQYVLEEN